MYKSFWEQTVCECVCVLLTQFPRQFQKEVRESGYVAVAEINTGDPEHVAPPSMAPGRECTRVAPRIDPASL